MRRTYPTPRSVCRSRGSFGVDLLAQVRHVGLDDARFAAEVVLPHVVEDLGLREHASRIQHEVAQQLELGRRKRNFLAGLADLVRILVELDVGERKQARALVLHAAAGAAQHCADPGEHLFEAEGLDHVIVAAERQAGDLVLGRVARREEHDRHPVGAGAQLAQHVEAVHVGQHHVQEDEVRAFATGGIDRINARSGGLHRKTRIPQTRREQLDDVGLVVDHQQLCLDLASVLPGSSFTFVHVRAPFPSVVRIHGRCTG